MKEIPLTNGRVALVDDEDYDALSKLKWYFSKAGADGYAMTSNKGVVGSRLMHRIIMKNPDNLIVDHKNHDTLDNRKGNLRAVNTRSNHQNRINQRDYIGVIPINDRYASTVSYLNEQFYMGMFPTALEAAAAYENAVSFIENIDVIINTDDYHIYEEDDVNFI